MNHYHVAKDDYLFGSGQVEAANKVLMTQHIKSSGQRWGRDDGQGVHAHRALLKSDRFDKVWRMAAPKMERSKKRCDLTIAAANPVSSLNCDTRSSSQ